MHPLPAVPNTKSGAVGGSGSFRCRFKQTVVARSRRRWPFYGSPPRSTSIRQAVRL